MAAHRYWRVRGILYNDLMAGSLLEFRSVIGGPQTAVGGTPIVSGVYGGGFEVEHMFDTDNGSIWAANSNPAWVGYDYGSGNEVSIVEIAYRAREGYPTQTPYAARVEWSDDGVAWTEAFGVFFGKWTSGETKVRSKIAAPAPGARPHKFWRINHAGQFAAAVEIEFRATAGGADLLETQQIYGFDGGHYSNWYAGLAYDNDFGSVYAGDQYAAIEFANPVTVDEFTWTPRSDGGDNYQVATGGSVDWSDNGTDWTVDWVWGRTPWPSGVQQVLTNPALAAGLPHAKWRIKIDTVGDMGRHCFAAGEVQFYSAPYTPGLVPQQAGYSASLIYGSDSYGEAWKAFDHNAGTLWHNDCSGPASAYIGWDFGVGNEVVVKAFSFQARSSYSDSDFLKTGGLEFYNEALGAWQRAFSIAPQTGWVDEETRAFSAPGGGVSDPGGYRFWEIMGTSGGGGYIGVSGCQMAREAGPDLTDPVFTASQRGGPFQAGSVGSIFAQDDGLAQWYGSWSDLAAWFAADFGAGNERLVRRITIFPNRDDVNRTFLEFDVAVWNNPDRSDRIVLQHFVCDPWVHAVGQEFHLDAYAVEPAGRRRQATFVC